MTIIGYADLAAAVFALDYFIKEYIERNGTEGCEEKICHEKLILKKYHNRGALLNLGEKKSKIVALLSLILTLMASVVFLATFGFRGKKMLKAGLALLLGGAYSNTYDRLARKYVVDYVSFPVKNAKIRSLVFNISDFCIVIGALFMAIGSK